MLNRLFNVKFIPDLLIQILVVSILANSAPLASGVDDLTINFIEVGENGVLSMKFPTTRLSITNSYDQFVSGVAISIVAPHYAYPYYAWTVTERTSDYLVRVNSFPFEAIRDDFLFTFEKAGYNTKTISRELVINAVSVAFIDEHGIYKTDSGVQLNAEAMPPHILVSSQFQTVFVDSAKYFVTFYAYQSEFVWEKGLCYIVLDANYDLVQDEQTCNRAIFAYLVGPHFAQAFSTETLDQLSAWAQEMIFYSGLAYLLAEIRDHLSRFAGWLIGVKLGSASGQLSKPAVTSQKILDNVNKINDFWLSFMTRNPSYFEKGVVLTEIALFMNAIDKLNMAGDLFLSLRDTVDSYRGTTTFDYSQINSMYEKWVDASCNVLVAIDILESILPDASLLPQVAEIAVNMVAGFTGIPVDMLLDIPGIVECMANSLSKYAAMRDEFYEWIESRYDASTLLRQKIESTGHTRVIIPVPGANDFTVSAYHVSSQRTSTTVFAGQTAEFTVDVRLTSGTVPIVSLSVSGQDSTMSASFTPQSAKPPFISTLRISTSSSTSGRFVLTLLGSGADLIRSSQITLEVLNPPPPSSAISVDPLNSATGTIMYGAYTRYHGTVDPYYNGRKVWLAQSVDGGNMFYLIAGYIPTSNNEWYYPSSMNAVPIWLSSSLGIELPCTYQMKAGIEGTILESNIVSFIMVKATTSTEISFTPDIVVEGETVTISGSVFSSLGISGSIHACKGTWFIEWKQAGSDWKVLASGSVYAEFKIPPDGGPYSILFDVPTQMWTPSSPGTYSLRVRYSGDKNYEASVSDEETVVVEPGTYPITVSIKGLPSENHTDIYIDGIPIDTLAGGECGEYEVSRDGLHRVSVDADVSYASDIRYLCSTPWQVVSASGSYDFTYHKEYKLIVEVFPAQSGSVDLTGSTWFDADSIVEARANPNASFTFGYWTIDSAYSGSSESLLLTMDTPHILRAFFVGANAFHIVRGLDNRIYYRIYDSSTDTWDEWNSLPGATCDSPAATVCCGKLHIVVRGMDENSLWHGCVDLSTGTFDGWIRLSGSTSSAPTLTSNGTALCLVVRGLDNCVYYGCVSCEGSWATWHVVLSGATCDSPAAALLGSDLHIVVKGMDENSLWHTKVHCDGTGFTGWTRISGATPSLPALAASQSTSKVYLVVRGLDDRIYYREYDASTDSWESWEVVPTGATCDGPGATVVGDQLHVVVRGVDEDTLWHGYLTDPADPSSFVGWSWISGSTHSAPTLTS